MQNLTDKIRSAFLKAYKLARNGLSENDGFAE